MMEYKYDDMGKVINLNNARMRKKHKRIFDFINNMRSIFHKDTKNKFRNKAKYKKSVNN